MHVVFINHFPDLYKAFLYYTDTEYEAVIVNYDFTKYVSR